MSNHGCHLAGFYKIQLFGQAGQLLSNADFSAETKNQRGVCLVIHSPMTCSAAGANVSSMVAYSAGAPVGAV